MTIDKAKRELEFDCLNKMAEACEIGKTAGLSFSAYKGSDGSLKIHKISMADETPEPNEDLKEAVPGRREVKQEISMDEFMREYKELKRKQSSVKNTYFSGGVQSRGVTQNTIVSSYSLNRINKKERQEELKQVLLETM